MRYVEMTASRCMCLLVVVYIYVHSSSMAFPLSLSLSLCVCVGVFVDCLQTPTKPALRALPRTSFSPQKRQPVSGMKNNHCSAVLPIDRNIMTFVEPQGKKSSGSLIPRIAFPPKNPSHHPPLPHTHTLTIRALSSPIHPSQIPQASNQLTPLIPPIPAPAPTTPAPPMMSVSVPTPTMLPTILDLVLEHAAADRARDHAHEAMALLLAEVVTRPAAAHGAQEAPVLVGHGGGVGVVVGRVGVGGLGRRRGRGTTLLLLVVLVPALAHGLLVRLVLRERVLPARRAVLVLLGRILLLGSALVVAVVARLALRV